MVARRHVLRRSAGDVARVQWLPAALDDATTVRDVSRVVVAALREPLGADRVALAELVADRLAVTVLDPPSAGPGRSCGGASGARSGPTRRSPPCPRSRRHCGTGG